MFPFFLVVLLRTPIKDILMTIHAGSQGRNRFPLVYLLLSRNLSSLVEPYDCNKHRIISEVCVRYVQSCVYVRTFALVIASDRLW